MLSLWPAYDEKLSFPTEENHMQGIMDIIRAVRALRADLKVQPGHKARLMLRPAKGWEETLRGAAQHFQRLASTSTLEILSAETLVSEKIVSAVCSAAEVLIPLGDLVDLEKEAQRARRDYENMRQEIDRSEAKLNNQGFLAKAPQALVDQERMKLEENKAMLKVFKKRMDELND